MKRSQEAQAVEMIPVDRITVINPRVRNKKIFKEIISNIGELGLKKPITVTRRADADGPRYDLVCGQGRLEAYQALGQREIPALVVDADTEDCLIMSLVENLARRQHRAIDLLHDIEGLKKRGYNDIDDRPENRPHHRIRQGRASTAPKGRASAAARRRSRSDPCQHRR